MLSKEQERDEAIFSEVEKALLSVSHSRRKLQKAAKQALSLGAEPHVVEALERTDRELEAAYKRLFQETYFAAPEPQAKLFEKNEDQRTLSQ